jgi:tetratricopeptide (TPR) repeat protein
MDSRQYAAAIESFMLALNSAHEPGPELFLLLGRAELEAGKPEEARRVVTEATKRFPADLDVKVFQGEVLIAAGDEVAAREFYKGLLRDAGDSSETYARVSEALLRQKRYALADGFLKEGTRRHPENDALLFARGAALERQGRALEAERLLTRSIQINPKNAMALNYLGYMLADRGVKLKEALGYVQRALSLDPKNAAYLDSLGWAQYKLALYDEAEKSLRAALAYDEDDPTIREHLGDLLIQTGRAEEALREWQAALERGHEEPDRVRNKVLKAQAGRQVTP